MVTIDSDAVSEEPMVRRGPGRPPKKSRAENPVPEYNTAEAVAFGMAMAEALKREEAEADKEREEAEIKLSARPVSRSRGEITEQFPKADLEEFRRRLMEIRDQATNDANAMKATGFNETDDRESDGGDGTNQNLRLQALSQIGSIHRTIQQIEEALHRIDEGTYGICTVCGQLIRKPRLLCSPFVLTCMECQSSMERKG